MFSLLIYAIVQSMQAQVASGIPVNRSTNSNPVTVGWVSEAPDRGTLSIIISCVSTMGLCVWSALHLNIPSAEESSTQIWLRSMKWMLLGLFGPELVVFAAWRQYVSARALGTIVDRLNRLEKPDSLATANIDKVPTHHVTSKDSRSSDSIEWSMLHGFYAGMGGFVFDLDPDSASILSPYKSQQVRLSLTPRGIARLAECGLLPHISGKDIQDKSKADGLAKTLVCLQAGWMVLQVGARIAYGLPVTLLEVNTIGHVICTFVIYILWWHKPRFIMEPTSIRGEWVQSVCAYMWMSSTMSNDSENERWWLWSQRHEAELAKLVFFPCLPQDGVQNLPQPGPMPTAGSGHANPDNSDDAAFVLKSEDCNHCTPTYVVEKHGFGHLGLECAHQLQRAFPLTAGRSLWESPSAEKVQTSRRRWRLALDAMQEFPELIDWTDVDGASSNSLHSSLKQEELLCTRAGNWHTDGLLSDFRGVLMGMALWCASMAFGGVHAAAWNEYFPSQIETLLWRSCSIYIMGSGLIWLCINFLGRVSKSFNAYWDEILAGDAHWLSYTTLGLICALCGLAYGFARVFLVVEAVISLRSLPLAAYDTPSWSQLVPHL